MSFSYVYHSVSMCLSVFHSTEEKTEEKNVEGYLKGKFRYKEELHIFEGNVKHQNASLKK